MMVRATDIPKVRIGNPELSDLAFDFIPDYVPKRHSEFSFTSTGARWGARPLQMDEQDRLILVFCDGERSVFEVCDTFGKAWGLSREVSSKDVFARLKTLRSAGLIIRDNSLRTPGMFVRVRSIGQPASPDSSQRWVYLPPASKRVLELCSGSFSAREIAQVLISEELMRVSQKAAEASVLAILEDLESQSLVAVIDDEKGRDDKRRQFLRKARQREEVMTQ